MRAGRMTYRLDKTYIGVDFRLEELSALGIRPAVIETLMELETGDLGEVALSAEVQRTGPQGLTQSDLGVMQSS